MFVCIREENAHFITLDLLQIFLYISLFPLCDYRNLCVAHSDRESEEKRNTLNVNICSGFHSSRQNKGIPNRHRIQKKSSTCLCAILIFLNLHCFRCKLQSHKNLFHPHKLLFKKNHSPNCIQNEKRKKWNFFSIHKNDGTSSLVLFSILIGNLLAKLL